MSTLELAKKIGKTGTIHTTNGLTVQVTILDVKVSWNKERYLVTPKAGSGETWVENIVIKDGE